jgi:hypothetical protein
LFGIVVMFLIRGRPTSLVRVVVEGSPNAGGGRFTSAAVEHVDGDIVNNHYGRL